jgi:hypothetical protein
MRKILLATAGVAATLALTQAPARAALVFTDSTFTNVSGTFNAAIDQTDGLKWVSPNIATGDTFGTISALCNGVGGACHGALAGLDWATKFEVAKFETDVGIPLDVFNEYPIHIGVDLLSPLINQLGPTHAITIPLVSIEDFLGGITNDGLTLGVPNTSYMYHIHADVGLLFDSEAAFRDGAGNGFAELPATKGWFFATPTTSGIPESSTWAMMIIGFAFVGFSAYRAKRNRLDDAIA